jgi:Ca-activated chloride channel family protein
MTRIDEGLLQELAEATSGRYVHVDPESFALDDVRTMLEELSRSQREDTVDIHREEGFPFFVVPALLLVAIAIALPERRSA